MTLIRKYIKFVNFIMTNIIRKISVYAREKEKKNVYFFWHRYGFCLFLNKMYKNVIK